MSETQTSSPVTLEYSSAPPRYFRWRGVFLLCGLSFVLGAAACFLMLPIYRQYEAVRQRNISVTIRRDEIMKRFEEQMFDAGQASAKGDVNDARASLEGAEIARDADSPLFTEAELEAMTQRISKAGARIDAVAATQPHEPPATRSTEITDQRGRTIASLVSRCGDFVRAGRYRQAAGICVQILELDPENDYGHAMFPLLKDLVEEVENRHEKE